MQSSFLGGNKQRRSGKQLSPYPIKDLTGHINPEIDTHPLNLELEPILMFIIKWKDKHMVSYPGSSMLLCNKKKSVISLDAQLSSLESRQVHQRLGVGWIQLSTGLVQEGMDRFFSHTILLSLKSIKSKKGKKWRERFTHTVDIKWTSTL